VALAHASMALFAAVAASILLVRGGAFGWWLLGAASVVLPSAVLASLPHRRAPLTVPWGGVVLVASQLGALAWALVVLGPRVELVALAPAGIWLAYRLGGLALAAGAACGAALLTIGFSWAGDLQLYQPAVVLSQAGSTVLATLAVALGLGPVLWTVESSEAARTKSERAALVRLDEARALRKQVALGRSHLERDAELLGETLVVALHGKGVRQLTIDGPLGPVAEIANAVAERLQTLQKDREDRIRLEGALRQVISAVERGWLGLPWHWPSTSGTAVDELVALLRAPRARERARETSDDCPTLLPLPDLASSSGYRHRPLLPEEQRIPSYPGVSSPHLAQALFGWHDLLGAK
jgi:hypothetical protein